MHRTDSQIAGNRVTDNLFPMTEAESSTGIPINLLINLASMHLKLISRESIINLLSLSCVI